MSFKALVYAYVIGGFTFFPLLLACAIFYTVYTSVPVPDPNDPIPQGTEATEEKDPAATPTSPSLKPTDLLLSPDVRELPRVRKGWLTVRRTFEESTSDGSYVTLMRSFLDSRSKDPKRSRPKDMWYVALKGKVLYLYEDEGMGEVDAAIELGGHEVVIYPEGLLDGELFAKRNAICLKPKLESSGRGTPELSKKTSFGSGPSEDGERKAPSEKAEEKREAITPSTPWFIFASNIIEMEDWYLSFIHASDNPPNQPPLSPLAPVFDPVDMFHLVETLDEQPDVIPMRWFNALIGRIFFSFYRTHVLEDYIIGRLMRKLSKVKRPAFLTDVVVTEVSVGNTSPTFSKPMLKELTKEGDASLEVRVHYKGEIRITVQAVVTINLGARFKSYSVKLVLAIVLRELEGNLLVKVKRPPSSRIWYAFTQMPKMVLDVEPVVSDRQITWNMILSQIESRLKEVIMESVVMPNMDDISFFGSSKYSHRGGIWADAARCERQHTTMDGSPDPNTHLPQVQVETGPESLSTTLVSPPPPTQDPNLAAFLAEDNKDQDQEHPNDGPQKDDSFEASSPPRSTTSGVSQARSVPSSSTRRRSWFAPARDEDPNTEPEPSLLHADDTLGRGRPEVTTHDTPSSPRSTSAHSDTSLDPNVAPFEPSSLPKTPPPLQRRRELPQQPESDETAPAPSKSPQSLFGRVGTNASTNSGSSTAGSFFSTLKARAADKEALKDSAKEAMKKWSANWASLKKGGSEEPGPGTDDGQSKGSSYAEIRRHVEERQKTTHTPGSSTGANETPSLSATSRTSPSPRTQGGSRKPSISSSLSSGPPASNPDPVSHSSSQDAQVDLDDREPEKEVTLPAPAPQPIYTQPSAPRMMMIPGIHASHRGEVQSMGYVVPKPEPEEPKLKAPAMQSVYRLWKNPGSGQPTSSSTEPTESSHLEGGDVGSSTSHPSQNDPHIPTSPSLSPNFKRMLPPPLPARTAAVRPLEASVTNASPDQAEFGNLSASAALKSIVSLDNNGRRNSSSSFENVDSNLQPPLVAATGDS